MRKTKSFLLKISLMYCLTFFLIPCHANSQTINTGNNYNGLNRRQKSLNANDNQFAPCKHIFALGLGAKLFQPPSENDTKVNVSYGVTAEFQFIRNDVLTWYLNLDYYAASYDYGHKNWILALAGARIYPEKKSYGLNFNIAGGPLFTDADRWKVMFDIGVGYEIKLNDSVLLNPYGCLHSYIESGPDGFSIIPKPKSSYSIGATVSILL
ncbi:MAG: hypothetical protein LWX07_02795 [Bacteroidetes bacterium]|nr:hypothetical protein [Bacteroidota bacterium]